MKHGIATWITSILLAWKYPWRRPGRPDIKGGAFEPQNRAYLLWFCKNLRKAQTMDAGDIRILRNPKYVKHTLAESEQRKSDLKDAWLKDTQMMEVYVFVSQSNGFNGLPAWAQEELLIQELVKRTKHG